MDAIYSAEQIEVPASLPALLKAYTKEVIRNNPDDIPAFSRESVHTTHPPLSALSAHAPLHCSGSTHRLPPLPSLLSTF